MHLPVIRFLTSERIALLVLGLALWGATALLGGPGMELLRAAQAYRQDAAHYDSLLVTAAGHDELGGQLQATHDSLQAVLERLTGGMIPASDLSGLLTTLIDMAKSAGIPYVGVKPQGADQMAAQCPVLLEFSCSYPALGRFVAALESQPHLSRVDRLAITARDARSVTVKLLITVFLNVEEAGG